MFRNNWMLRYVIIQNQVAFRSSDGLYFRIVVRISSETKKDLQWYGVVKRGPCVQKPRIRKQTYSPNNVMVYAHARLGRSIVYPSLRHAFLNSKLRNYKWCRTKLAIKAVNMLRSLGARLSVFSANCMQKARGFMFALKIQTREKKTEMFHLTKKADI